MKILILTGGTNDVGFTLGLFQKEHFALRIVADSALEIWDKMGETDGFSEKIDHLVGDFDSVSPDILQKYINREEIQVHRFVPEKDYTDTDIALKLAIDLCRQAGAGGEIYLVGATGTRLDHTLANLQLLTVLEEAGLGGVILDPHNRIRLLRGEICLKREDAFGSFFSLIPLTQTLRGVSIRGAKYELDRQDVHMGESLCVSNEFASEQVEIRIKEGSAFLIESRD